MQMQTAPSGKPQFTIKVKEMTSRRQDFKIWSRMTNDRVNRTELEKFPNNRKDEEIEDF